MAPVVLASRAVVVAAAARPAAARRSARAAAAPRRSAPQRRGVATRAGDEGKPLTRASEPESCVPRFLYPPPFSHPQTKP